MSTVLKVVGVGWALLGVWNILLSAAHHAPSGVGAIVLLVSFLLFIFPGLLLAGLGSMIARKQSGPPPLPRSYPRK
jgi:hypothetical protein